MDLKKFLEKTKTIKSKNSLLDLTYNILSLEELLVESSDQTKEINYYGELLKSSFVFLSENKIEIASKENPDLDLDNWKNSIKKYKITNTISKDTYLYTIRNSLKNLIKAGNEKNELNAKIFIFELIIKTFLYIDYLDFSIDTILENKMKSIQEPIKQIVPSKNTEKEDK